MKNNVLILYSSVNQSEIMNYINSNIDYNYFGLITDNDAYKLEDLRIIKFIKQEDYLNPNELHDIDEISLEIAKNWYVHNSIDLSKKGKVSLGKVCQYDIMNISCQLLQSYNLINKIIHKNNISLIILSSTNKYFTISGNILAANNGVELYKLKTDNVQITKLSIRNKLIRIINKYDSLLYSLLNFVKRKSDLSFFYSERNISLINELSVNYGITLLTLKPIIKLNLLLNGRLRIIKVSQSNLLENDFTFISKLLSSFNLYVNEKFNNNIVNIFNNSFIQLEITNYLKLYISYINSKTLNQKAKLVIVGQDFQGVQRLFVEVSKQFNIKTIVLQHGVYGFFPFFVSPISNYIAVWGEKWKEWLSSIGDSDLSFVVIGEPYYDKLLRLKENKKKSQKIEVLIPFQPNVTISSFSNYSINELKIIKILNVLVLFENRISVTLKMRNNEQIEHGYKIKNLSKYKNKISIVGKTNNFKLLAKSDIVVTSGSTMGFEALLLNKTVLVENFDKMSVNESHPFYSDELSTKFESAMELEQILNSIINNSSSDINVNSDSLKKLVEKKYYPSGESTIRCIKEIRKIL